MHPHRWEGEAWDLSGNQNGQYMVWNLFYYRGSERPFVQYVATPRHKGGDPVLQARDME